LKRKGILYDEKSIGVPLSDLAESGIEVLHIPHSIGLNAQTERAGGILCSRPGSGIRWITLVPNNGRPT
jgi:hypothetical protein